MHLAKAGPLNPLSNLSETIDQHWREHRPKMYAELKRSGELKEAIKAADEQTSEAVLQLVAEGLDFWKAWEMMREDWALLPSEEDQPELGVDPLAPPNPDEPSTAD